MRKAAQPGAPSTARTLKDELPDVYAELHPTKNSGIDSEKLTCGSQGRCGGSAAVTRAGLWVVSTSTLGRPELLDDAPSQISTGCPFCSGRRVCPCNSLAVLHPALLQYWDTGKNVDPLGEPLDPFWLGVHSNRKVWWRHECAEGRVHHWTARILMWSNASEPGAACLALAALLQSALQNMLSAVQADQAQVTAEVFSKGVCTWVFQDSQGTRLTRPSSTSMEWVPVLCTRVMLNVAECRILQKRNQMSGV